MQYYPHPFRSSADAGDERVAALNGWHDADAHLERAICLVVGLFCLGVLSALVWP
ncbi:MAG TPA: hypothetical protein VEB23_06380 [Ramlibacter sp.]|nr:hypothetical protein [Ramlibacter sp.]